MKSRKLIRIALGVLTAIGGFLDVGAVATAAEAGSRFRFRLLWVVALGTLCVIFLVEMVGRLASISQHAYADAVRERFGFQFYAWSLIAEFTVDFLVLGAEIGGVALALQLVTGIGFQWWAIPVAIAVWLTAWLGTFSAIENSVALLGLITLVFVFSTVALHPPWGELAAGFIPTLPSHDTAHYLFVAVSIMGAILSPYLLYFYSSGAIEDQWSEADLGINRVVAAVGMGFGSVVQMGVLATAALVLAPRGIRIEQYSQIALTLSEPFGHWGYYLFAASLGIACFGACMEQALETSYVAAQAFGWNWGESKRPAEAARFSIVYTLGIFSSALLMVIGLDPLKLTMFSMALTALMLPIVVVPLLVLMNDRRYLGEHTNRWFSNGIVGAVLALTCVIAIVAIPLEYFGG